MCENFDKENNPENRCWNKMIYWNSGMEDLERLLREEYQLPSWKRIRRIQWEETSRYFDIDKIYTQVAWVIKEDAISKIQRYVTK